MAVGIIGSPIAEGRTVSLFETTSPAAITEVANFSIEANGILLGVFVTSVTGSVTVTCHTVGDDGQLKGVIAFPAITSPTTELQLKETLTVLSKIRVTVVATGAASYRVFGKAISVTTVAASGGTVDIRDLEFSRDSVDISGSTVGISGPVDISGSSVDITGEVDIRNLVAGQDSILTAGTEDGTVSGPVRIFVNSIRNQILAAEDRVQDITYADFGTKNQRVTSIIYSAPAFGVTAVKTFTYTLVGTRYRRDAITWSLI